MTSCRRLVFRLVHPLLALLFVCVLFVVCSSVLFLLARLGWLLDLACWPNCLGFCLRGTVTFVLALASDSALALVLTSVLADFRNPCHESSTMPRILHVHSYGQLHGF